MQAVRALSSLLFPLKTRVVAEGVEDVSPAAPARARKFNKHSSMELDREFSNPVRKKSLEGGPLAEGQHAEDHPKVSSKLAKNPLHFIQFLPDAVCVVTAGAVIILSNQKFKQMIPTKVGFNSQFSVLSCVKASDREDILDAIVTVSKAEDRFEFVSVTCKTFVYNTYGNKGEDNCDWIVSSDGTPDCIVITVRTHNKDPPTPDKKVSPKRRDPPLSKVATNVPPLRVSRSMPSTSFHHNQPLRPRGGTIVEESYPSHGANALPLATNEQCRSRHPDPVDIGRISAKSAFTEAFKYKDFFTRLELETIIEQLKIDSECEIDYRKRNFVRNLSHLIRSPVAAALAALTIAQREVPETSPKITETLRDIRCSCENAVGILNDFLTYDKLKSDDGLVLDMVLLDLLEIVRDSIEQFRLQAAYSNVSLQYVQSIGDATALYMNVDVRNISHVFRNILSCSMKCASDWESLLIEVVLVNDGAVRINFKDSCSTSTVQDKEKMFEETSGELLLNHGTGLGLYVSKQIVELHGGVMEVVSSSLEDSYFSMVLPLLPSIVTASPSLEAPPVLADDSALSAGPRKFHLLIVDDDPIILKVHARLFASHTASCTVAPNGIEAVRLAKFAMSIGQPHDCVLMDLSMPLLDGPSATQQLREAGFTGKINGVTGNCSASDFELFMSNGADKVYLKPLSTDFIEEIIEAVFA